MLADMDMEEDAGAMDVVVAVSVEVDVDVNVNVNVDVRGNDVSKESARAIQSILDVTSGVDDEEAEEEEEEEEELLIEDSLVRVGVAVHAEHSRAMCADRFPSKVGGLPAWLHPTSVPDASALACGASNKPMDFVAQLYAPLSPEDGVGIDTTTGELRPDVFHRAIFIFASPHGESWNVPGAIRAFRCQLPRANEFYSFEPPPEDDDDDDDDGRENDDSTYMPAMVEPLHPLFRWQAAARAMCGVDVATGAVPPPSAVSAACCALDAPAQPSVVPAEAAAAAAGADDARVARVFNVFPERELDVAFEADLAFDENADAASEWRRREKEAKRALKEWEEIQRRKRAAAEEKEKASASGSTEKNSGGDEGENEEDEDDEDERLQETDVHDPAKLCFARFSQRVAYEPAQVVRYSLNDADVLWPRPEPCPSSIPPCPLCGAPRRFELQLMPQLVSVLGFDAADSTCPDIGTAAIYTCARSCTPSNTSTGSGAYAEEFVFIQPPP